MSKGQILKVKVGHDANCSSGMMVFYLWSFGAATYLPLSIVAAVVQAIIARRAKKTVDNTPRDKMRRLSWLIPLILGTVAAVLLVGVIVIIRYVPWPFPMLALSTALSYVLAVIVGHLLAPKIRYPFLICLIAPVIFAASAYLLLILLLSL